MTHQVRKSNHFLECPTAANDLATCPVAFQAPRCFKGVRRLQDKEKRRKEVINFPTSNLKVLETSRSFPNIPRDFYKLAEASKSFHGPPRTCQKLSQPLRSSPAPRKSSQRLQSIPQSFPRASTCSQSFQDTQKLPRHFKDFAHFGHHIGIAES